MTREIKLDLVSSVVDNESSGVGWFQLGDGHTQPRAAREEAWLRLHGIDPRVTPVRSDVTKVIGRRAWAIRQFLTAPDGRKLAGAMGVAIVAFRYDAAGRPVMPEGHTGWRP